MVGALEFSSDPTVKECVTLLKDPEFLKRLDIPSDTCTILEAAGESISLITKTAIKRKAKDISTNTGLSTGILPSSP